MGGGVRADGIPADVRKTIQTIKEIAGSYSDEEIYAMLKESNMDPNETAQKLLSQDPFHEVKRKRDKKKENAINRDSGDVRAKSGNQGRGGRFGTYLDQGAGRGSYLPSYNSLGACRGFRMARDNKIYQGTSRGYKSDMLPPATPQNEQTEASAFETSSLPASTSANPIVPNGSSGYVQPSQTSRGSWSTLTEHPTIADGKSTNVSQSPMEIQSAEPASTSTTVQGQLMPNCQPYTTLAPANSVSGVYSPSSDPVLLPSLALRVSGVVGTIKREVGMVGTQRPSSEHSVGSLAVESSSFSCNLSESLQLTQSSTQNADVSTGNSSGNEKFISATVLPLLQDGTVKKSKQLNGDHLSEKQSWASTSSTLGASVRRSSFMGNHYSSRSQHQPVGHLKATGPNMEWKPKPINQSRAPHPGVIGASTVSIRCSEVSTSSQPPSGSANLEDAESQLQEKLEEINIRDERENQHVIIPNHLQVPEANSTGISFGSFAAEFGTNFSSSFGNDNSDMSYTPHSEASQGAEASNEEEPLSSLSKTSPFARSEDYSRHQETSTSSVVNVSGSKNTTDSVTPTAVSQSESSKKELVAPPAPQYPLVQTAPNYTSIGLMPQIMRNQYPSHEPVESHQHVPSFVQGYDPSTSFYTSFIRAGPNGDTYFPSMVGSPSASNYNGNLTFLTGQSAPSSQERGNTVVLSTSGPTAQGTQTAGMAQTTIPLPQQPMRMFPQPASLHISHFPPSYLPYHQYLSPLYVPSPTIHGFAGNAGYPQLPSGSNFPLPSGSSYPSAAAAVKHTLPQYKPGTASGNSLHRSVPSGFGGYTTAPGFAVNPAVTEGSPSGFEDIAGPQYKESNLFIPSQQAEGSAIWIHAPTQDLLGMHSSSYYNLTTQGQNMAYAPTQSGHAAFTPTQSAHSAYAPSQSALATYAGLYHPTQSGPAPNSHHLIQQSQTLGGSVGVASAQIGAYQQQQRGQLNWTNNY